MKNYSISREEIVQGVMMIDGDWSTNPVDLEEEINGVVWLYNGTAEGGSQDDGSAEYVLEFYDDEDERIQMDAKIRNLAGNTWVLSVEEI